jgi:hypothetical protein
LDTEHLDDDLVSGVMPVLFAADIAAARQTMSVNIMPLRKDLDKINRMFFTPESVDLEGADSVIRKPRLGEAIYTFKDENLEKLYNSPGMILTYEILHIIRT